MPSTNPRSTLTIQACRRAASGLLFLALLTGPARATPEAAVGVAPSIAPLVGTWELTAADDLRPDGSRVPAYGEHPRGLLMIDASGQYSLQIYRTEAAKFASGDKKRGTPQEYEAAVLRMSAHVGHCTLDPANGIVTFAIDLAAYPNWEGTVQKRQYTLEGDTLSYQIPASASSGGNVPISVWKKVR